MKKEITIINESKSRSFFPENFSNEIYFSDLNSFHHSFSYESNYSIKFTAKGCESYIVDNQLKLVPSGQYLIVNDKSIVETVESWEKSEGISIFLDSQLLKDVQYYLKNGNHAGPYSRVEFEKERILFFDKTYNQGLELEQKLIQIHKHIYNSNNKFLVNEEFYFSLAESMLVEREEVREAFQKISAIKLSTREEIFKRVHSARNFLVDNIKETFDFNEICLQAGLSKFQLIRNFKSVFNQTPYQYYIKLKLEIAKELLLNQNHSISEISDYLNFNDIHSFSKIFKKHNKISPINFQRKSYKSGNF